MAYYKLNIGKPGGTGNEPPTGDTVPVDRQYLSAITEKICADKRCPDRLLALRIVLHAIGWAEKGESMETEASQLAKEFGLPHASVADCLHYLREINAIPSKKPRPPMPDSR